MWATPSETHLRFDSSSGDAGAGTDYRPVRRFKDGLEFIRLHCIGRNSQSCVVRPDGVSVTGVCRGKWQAA